MSADFVRVGQAPDAAPAINGAQGVVVGEPGVRAAGPHEPQRQFSRAFWLAALLVVVAAGVVLRFTAAGSLWQDEAQSVAIARLPLPHLLSALRGDGSPPMYYLLLHIWMQVFGTGDVAVRALSGLFAVAALPLFYCLAEHRAGPATLALAAVNPWLIRYATEARMYSLEVLLVLLALLALRGVRRAPTPWRVAACAVVTGLLLLTHYWALYLYAAAGLVLAASWLRTRAAWLGWSLVGLAACALLFLPWLPSFLVQTRHTGTPWSGPGPMSGLPSLVGQWFAPLGGRGTVLVLVVWPLIIWGAARGGWRARAMGVVGAVTLLLALADSRLTHAAVVTRYTAVVVPAVLLLLGSGVAGLRGRWRPVMAVLLVLAFARVSVTVARAPRTEAPKVASVLNAQAKPQDTVIFCPDQLSPAVVRLLTVKLTLRTFPAQSTPGLMNWIDYRHRVTGQDPGALARTALPPHTSVWLVMQSGYAPFGGRCQSLIAALDARFGAGQQLVAPWPKPEPEGTWRWDVP